MIHRSLISQLFSFYLLFVAIVLVVGLGINLVAEQQLRDDAQTSDQVLAQEIALETSLKLHDTENALIALSKIVARAHTAAEMQMILRIFQATRNDVDTVSWLSPFGNVLVSWPGSEIAMGAEFSPPGVITQARLVDTPVYEVGIATETTFNAAVIIAEPVRDGQHRLLGIVVANLSLVELGEPLSTVVQAQLRQRHHFMISIIDGNGELVATADHRRMLQTIVDELPGASQALRGRSVSSIGEGYDGQNWLYSSVPVPGVGWAVVVQRPTSEALAVVTQFHLWLLIAALFFALGGIFFWVILMARVMRPLHLLTIQHQRLPASIQAISPQTFTLARREDEVGHLARSFIRLERDGIQQLGELRTLLETSNAVVSSLEPHSVVKKIIYEVRRLVDVQAAAVLIPDVEGVLRVLMSDGHSQRYDDMLSLAPQDVSSSAVLALRDQKPVQKLLVPSTERTTLSYDEGFRSVLAIPIISRHGGSVVLLVHRIEPHIFAQNEIDLLLTFANHATLAWEHARLYERSDERLRMVAQENERLYRQAWEEKQRLEAIMESMSDGLILTSTHGSVLYSNMAVSAITGLSVVQGCRIESFYTSLSACVIDGEQYEHAITHMDAVKNAEAIIEIVRNERCLSIHLRQFDVGNRSGIIGRGLLIQDVTREREIDKFKTTLLAAVGHELRTPLTAIKGHASTLLQEDVHWSDEDQRHFLQTISSEADRLTQLVRNLLDLSRQEAGLLLLNRAPSSVEDIIYSEVAQLRSPEREIALHIEEGLPWVDVDSVRIGIVLHNLVANALRYGEGVISLMAARRENSIVITVADMGPGIAEEELTHIFERFYQSPRSRSQHSGGTGLGLAICKAFVEAHGSTIWACSDMHGTSISFTLPVMSLDQNTQEWLESNNRR